VVLHARDKTRAREARSAVPGADTVVVADLTSMAQTRSMAEQVNKLSSFDAVIHNAGVGYREPRIATEDGLPHVFAVNTLAPYILTALIEKPKRLVYLSSGLHRSGDASLEDLTWEHRPWQEQQAYCDSKLHDVLLAFAIARHWPNVLPWTKHVSLPRADSSNFHRNVSPARSGLSLNLQRVFWARPLSSDALAN
jgi:NAD(P)-dependent dehydrogenase (short-subunit alcohol dehydrogenase family)